MCPRLADGAKLISSYADALMASGHFAEGEEQYRRAQKVRERVLPPGHVERLLGLQRIGAALVIQKRAKEALPILQEAYAAIANAFPPLRREAIDGVRYLAMAEEELGHLERAVELRREVFARRAKVHGAESGMALDARADLASALGDLGHDGEAITELEAVVAGFLAVMGDKSVNASDARVKLANKLISVGRFAEADAALAIAVPMLAKANGPDSPYTMVGEYALVRSYVERPKPFKLDEATRLLDRMEPVFAKLFGQVSYPVAAVISSRARIAFAKADAKRADVLISEAIGMLGDDKRSDRAEMLLVRARVLVALGRRDEARALAEASAKDYDAAGPGFAQRAAAARAWAAKPTAAAPVIDGAVEPAATPAKAVATGACAKAGDAIADVWPDERDSVESWHRRAKQDSTQVIAVIDRYVEDWRAAAQAACAATQTQSADLTARRQLCLDRARERATARIMAVANGTLRAITTRRSLPDFTVCANASTLQAETVPPTAEARDRVERGERYLEEARIMLDIPYWQQASRNLSAARDQLRAYHDPSLAARADNLGAELDRVVEADRAKKAAKAANSP